MGLQISLKFLTSSSLNIKLQTDYRIFSLGHNLLETFYEPLTFVAFTCVCGIGSSLSNVALNLTGQSSRLHRWPSTQDFARSFGYLTPSSFSQNNIPTCFKRYLHYVGCRWKCLTKVVLTTTQPFKRTKTKYTVR